MFIKVMQNMLMVLRFQIFPFSAVDNWDELPAMVQEAIEVYCDGEDMELPKPSSLEELIKNEEYQGGIWMMLDINVSRLDAYISRH